MNYVLRGSGRDWVAACPGAGLCGPGLRGRTRGSLDEREGLSKGGGPNKLQETYFWAFWRGTRILSWDYVHIV
jgi:hypothetical protein